MTAPGSEPPGQEPPGQEPLFKSTLTLEQVNAWGEQTLNKALGIRITEIGPDFVRGTMPVDARTRQPFGLLHGGASIALAETLGSIAAQLAVGESGQAVGIEVNGNHLRSERDGLVTGTARALHIGGRIHVWEIRIENARHELVCMSRLTVAIKRREAQTSGA
jgi:1,4-dihydroxy-2-naphthoyl-CoA hydrolase